MRKKVVLVMDGNFEGALFQYSIGLAKQLASLGFVPVITGTDYSLAADKKADIEGVCTVSFCGESYIPTNRKSYRINSEKAYCDIAGYIAGLCDVSDIFLFAGAKSLSRKIKKISEKNNITCHVVALEYPTVEIKECNSLKGFLNELRVWSRRKYIFRTAEMNGNAVCISKRLFGYFEKRGCNCLYLPHIMDIGSERLEKREGRVNIIYCGYPGRKGSKDRLDLVIDAIAGSGLSGDEIALHIVGPDKETLIKQKCIGTSIAENDSRFIFHGALSQTELKSVYSSMDYSVLVRDIKNKTQYGYPTKVAESLSMGIPVICNITSDLGDVIFEGKTGVVLKNNSRDEILKGIIRAAEYKSNGINMTDTCITTVRSVYGVNARKSDIERYMKAAVTN